MKFPIIVISFSLESHAQESNPGTEVKVATVPLGAEFSQHM